jgi:hypothetical protein
VSTYLPKLRRILTLTPDSIGSTFFQRSLTLYLNMQGIPTKNYHDLALFAPNTNNLVSTLTKSNYSTVARVSPYRAEEFERSKHVYLKFCNIFFNDVYVVDRCSFESALSYCHRSSIGSKLNVYSKQQYIDNTSITPYNISIDKFIQSLKYFEDFYVWVDRYFPIHKKINHDDIIYNTDETYKNILNLSTDIDYSIAEYNKFNFLRVRDNDFSIFSKETLVNYFNVSDKVQELVANDLLPNGDGVPIKKITLEEKIKSITNFEKLLKIYNTYPSNHFIKVTEEHIHNRVKKEQTFWTT